MDNESKRDMVEKNLWQSIIFWGVIGDIGSINSIPVKEYILLRSPKERNGIDGIDFQSRSHVLIKSGYNGDWSITTYHYFQGKTRVNDSNNKMHVGESIPNT